MGWSDFYKSNSTTNSKLEKIKKSEEMKREYIFFNVYKFNLDLIPSDI